VTAIERVAAFDVDGTLTTTDCVVPFLRRTATTHRLVGGLMRRPVNLGRSLARRDRNALKSASAHAAFAGRAAADVEADARGFASEVFGHRLRREVVESLDAHVARGDTVLLVSASFEVYLRPLAELLGADDVLGTRLEVGSDGRYTGRLDGANCRGPEKVLRLHRWLDEHARGRSAVQVTAYGDSAGDRELLADADDPHWVGRGGMPVS